MSKVSSVLTELKETKDKVKQLKTNKNSRDFFSFETIRGSLDSTGKTLQSEEKELRKLSCRIADFSHENVVDKFSDLLHNTFILRKSYTSTKFVHYFEWGQKYIHFFDVEKLVSNKVTINNEQIIPKFCRTVVTDEGKVFCIGGRHQDNVCCDWMIEYIELKQQMVYRSPLLFRRSDFTALYSERGLIFVIGGNDAKNFYTACEKYDI